MASNGPASTASTASPTEAKLSILHILSPSPDVPQRLTFNDIPLATNIADLKQRISQSLPTQPPASQQRLIYRGRPLLNDWTTLEDILDPSDSREHTLHLVLPPKQIPLGSASAIQGSSIRVQESPNNAQTNHILSLSRLPDGSYPQGVRFRTSSPAGANFGPTGLSPGAPLSNEIEAGLRYRMEAIRRQSELQEQARRQPQQQVGQAAVAVGLSHPTPNLPAFQSLSVQATTSQSAIPVIPQQPPDGGMTSPMLSAPELNAFYRNNFNNSPLGSYFRAARLYSLQHHILTLENQLLRGTIPSVDEIARIRTQLYTILDDQCLSPLSPRDGCPEALLSRIINLSMRSDQLRILQSRSSATSQVHGPSAATHRDQHAPVYLLSSPSGFQAVVVSPTGAAAIQLPFGILPQPHEAAAIAAARPERPQLIPPNPRPPLIENVVRQALLNRAGGNRQDIIARNGRRVWLFIRLYFFCYLFSEPGSWTRIIFVSTALLVSLLSETGLFQRFQRVALEPVQQHLEGLLHAGEEEHLEPLVRRGNGANVPANPQDLHVIANQGSAALRAASGQPQRQIAPTGIQQSLRRIERSLALFLASLIPGIWERHIGARNAAEAARNAERAREEEERRRQQETSAADDTDTPTEGSEHQQGPPEQESSNANSSAVSLDDSG